MKLNKTVCWISLLLLAVLSLTGCGASNGADGLSDGVYTVAVTLEGGSGKASIQSPTAVTVRDGEMTASIVWSSSNYDYMIVDGVQYTPVTLEPGSTFEIPIPGLDQAVSVTADTTAMSVPHEIEYTLTFDSASIPSQSRSSILPALIVLAAAAVLGGTLISVRRGRRGRNAP